MGCHRLGGFQVSTSFSPTTQTVEAYKVLVWLARQMVRRGNFNSDLCPTCGQHKETCQHVIHCVGPGNTREKIWAK